MPKLDGVSATSLIRQFDPMTPIISMTSNSKPNEILTYYSHGGCGGICVKVSLTPCRHERYFTQTFHQGRPA